MILCKRFYPMISVLFACTAALLLGLLLFAPFARGTMWRATVTPLASIIGSGFLVSAPLLGREFGGYATLAITVLIGLAFLLGWTIRYNIRVVEPLLEDGSNKTVNSIEKISHIVLAFAYFISVAYYLSLLGNFVLEAMEVQNAAIANAIAMALLVFIGVLGLSGGAQKVAASDLACTCNRIKITDTLAKCVASIHIETDLQNEASYFNEKLTTNYETWRIKKEC